MGELLSALIGWLGQLIEFILSFIPRFKFLQCNERGVRYKGGSDPTEVLNGMCWYWPICTKIIEYNVSRRVLQVNPISIETKDGIPCSIGLTIVYRIADVIKYEVENFNTDESISEIAQSVLRNIVASLEWSKLTNQAVEGSRLDNVLTKRMGAELSKLGIEVESARPSDQVKISRVFKVFNSDERKTSEEKD